MMRRFALASLPARAQMRAAAMDHLQCHSDPNLYALVDAARDPLIYLGLQDFAPTEEIACLYGGATAEELAHVAPYLVRVGQRTHVFDWLWKGWGRRWGIFIRSAENLEGLRAHLRKLTKVRTEDGRALLFRFYDPNVLSIFLPTCVPAQIEEMFGPVKHFLMEASDCVGIEEFTRAAHGVQRRFLPLTGSADVTDRNLE